MAIVCPKCKRQYDVTLFEFNRTVICDCGHQVNASEKSAIRIPIDGILDLHTFSPSQVKDLIPDYISACLEQGISSVRIIHGKGTGSLQRTVHSILNKIEQVKCVDMFPHTGHVETVARLVKGQ